MSTKSTGGEGAHTHKLKFAGGAGIGYVPSEEVCRQTRAAWMMILPVMASPLEVWECKCGYWEQGKMAKCPNCGKHLPNQHDMTGYGHRCDKPHTLDDGKGEDAT